MHTSLDEFNDSVEEQIARLQPRAAAGGLRETTLGCVNRELRSSRWDIRFGRVAAVLLLMGIGINVATVDKRPVLTTGAQLDDRPTAESIAELAVTMADVNDSRTVSIYARHLATLSGFSIGSLQANAVLKEVDRCLSSTLSNGKEG